MEVKDLEIKIQQVIHILEGYHKALLIECSYKNGKMEIEHISMLIDSYRKLLEVAKTGNTNLSDYSVHWNYSAYFYCPINSDYFKKKYPEIDSLAKYSEKFSLCDVRCLNPVEFYFLGRETVIDII